MTKKELIIVETAFRLFAHYGVKKTTMSEIAASAGIARQTVYNAFENKEELIYSALKHYAGKTKASVEQDCEGLIEPTERLDVLFKHLAALPFEAMQQLPHIDEILEIEEGMSDEKKASVASLYREAIGVVLQPYEDRLQVNGITLEQIKPFLKGAFTQIKNNARDANIW